MHIVRWSAALGAALLISIPVAAEASTPSPTTSSTSTSAPSAPSTQTSTASAPSSSTTQTSTSKSTTTQTAPKSTSTAPTTQTTPAPGATAEAYAVEIDGILALSHTKASASGSGASSTADPLELGGSVPASQFGGTSNGPPGSSGALLDTGPSSQFRLALAPWSDTNSQSTSSSSANALADILLLDLGDQSTTQSASVRVLESQSTANWTAAQSTGSSSSDGAIIKAGGPSGLNIDVLHAESSSSGNGSSYLLSINGNQIGSSSQVNGQCTLSIPGLLSLNCLTSTGGVAGTVTSSGGSVLTSTIGTGAQSLPVNAFTASTQTTKSTPSVSSGSGGQTGGTGSGTGTGTGSGSAAQTSGSLPFTGLDALGLVGLALALGLSGTGLLWWSRRSRVTFI